MHYLDVLSTGNTRHDGLWNCSEIIKQDVEKTLSDPSVSVLESERQDIHKSGKGQRHKKEF